MIHTSLVLKDNLLFNSHILNYEPNKLRYSVLSICSFNQIIIINSKLSSECNCFVKYTAGYIIKLKIKIRNT